MAFYFFELMRFFMKIILIVLIILPVISISQTYRDVYSTGIYMLSDENNPSNNVKWVSPTINSSITFTLPPNFGQVGYAMTSLGDGSLTWTDINLFLANAAGSEGEIQFNNSSTFGASPNLFWDNTNTRLGVGKSNPETTLDISNSLGVSLSGNDGALALYSEQGVSDYIFYFKAPDNLTSSVTFTWPSNFTQVDQILTTNGNGNLAWATSWQGTNGDCVGQGVEPGTTGENTASGNDSFVGGGDNNQITGTGTNGFIGGGVNNSVSSPNSAILAGENNSISVNAMNSMIGGGRYNIVNGKYSIIYAGEYNKIDSSAYSAMIGAGRYNYVNSSYSGITGGESNTIASNSEYSIIGAGKTNVIESNTQYAGILAGEGNTISASTSFSAIGAGKDNTVSSNYSFIGAGSGNEVNGNYSSILGGKDNEVSGNYSFIGGGLDNEVSGDYAMALGRNAEAAGDYSVAMGRNAKANHDGSFVFTDANTGDVTSSNTNQLTMRFTGDIYFYSKNGTDKGRRLQGGQSSWSSVSDRNLKTSILELNPNDYLDKLKKLKIFSWSYKGYEDKKIRNYGPMAQDFYNLFGNDGLGYIGTDKTITFYDLSSVGILGVQALKEKVLNGKLKISELEYKNKIYEEEIEELKKLKKLYLEKIGSEVSK